MGYRTIVADPPWPYDGFASMPGMPFPSSRAVQGTPTTGVKTVVRPLPYAPMSLDDLALLPVNDLAEKGSRLFLWTTNRFLPDAFGLLAKWGFSYRQTLVWHKTGNPSPFGGSVAPIHTEFLLVSQKGSIEHLGRLPSSLIAAPKPNQEHSRKPEVFLDLVERVSPGPYLELFARRNRLGWDTWGNECLNQTDMESVR